MNILHVCHNYYPSVGGPQYTMKHLSERMVKEWGDDVSVCTTNSLYGPETKLFEKIEPAFEKINNVKVNRLSFTRWHYPILDLANKVHGKVTGSVLPHSILKKRWGLDSPAMNRMMAEADADVIMATTVIYNFADYPSWRFSTKNPKPFVLYGAIHLHKPLAAESPFIQRAKACDCYIANTEFERQELIKYGVSGDKIKTIGTGIDLEAFDRSDEEVSEFKKKQGIDADDIVIGFIGRLVKGKGVGLLLDAFRKLYATNKKVKLLLAGGTTDYVPYIKKVRDEENLPIILVENFVDNIKPLLYHSLDVFVLASQSESFGVVFLEAWACAKPVIGTNMGAIASLLDDGKDSLLFEQGDANDLFAKLMVLINDGELRNKMGEAGYQKVQQNFSWDVIVSRYREAYQTGIENFKQLVSRNAKASV